MSSASNPGRAKASCIFGSRGAETYLRRPVDRAPASGRCGATESRAHADGGTWHDSNGSDGTSPKYLACVVNPRDRMTSVELLYASLLRAWNERDARKFASLFAEDGSVVGFDGSQMNGRDEIESEIGGVFASHQTAIYVGKVRDASSLGPNVALLRAVVGMVPPGETDINPAVNAIQSLVAVKHGDDWSVALFQNTPAQFHGRPDLSDKLTEELRRALKEGS